MFFLIFSLAIVLLYSFVYIYYLIENRKIKNNDIKLKVSETRIHFKHANSNKILDDEYVVKKIKSYNLDQSKIHVIKFRFNESLFKNVILKKEKSGLIEKIFRFISFIPFPIPSPLFLYLTAKRLLVSSNQENRNTIIGLMVIEKIKKHRLLQMILIFSFLFLGLISHFNLADYNIYAAFFIFSMILIIQLDHILIDYRVKKGIYGNNEFESREIIDFILSHSDKDDFHDGGVAKKIIPEPDEIIEKVNEIEGRRA
ncbi:hypothetical protein [Marinobacterium stanieri]|uniref:Uncharacterized protein n=1 Tax=Marinobacterium stanieri TaxID=49186 RepID=A0A1N6PDD7_9GAMM|nr:hypothetical protein [Marinobacterium stanieri]SIQ02279.1 hypothetical protein SAMN05421647_101957 [Marinobacterium stanieri]